MVQDLTLWFNLKAQGIKKKKKIQQQQQQQGSRFCQVKRIFANFSFYLKKKKKIILLSKKNICEFYYQKSTKL